MSTMEGEVAELKRLGAETERARKRMNALAAARQNRMLEVIVEEGLTQTELARTLDVSPAVVQSALREARRRPLPSKSFADPVVMGRWVREARTRKGVDRRDLAQQLGVTQGWIRSVEEGHVDGKPGKLPELFDLLEMDVQRFAVRR